MTSFFTTLKRESIHAIPAVIFFTLSFNFIVLTESLMLEHRAPMPITYLAATLGGMVAGKILIIVNSMPFINAYPNKPLIYNIAWKFFLYSTVSFIFRLCDTYVHSLFKKMNQEMILKHFGVILTSPIFWSVQLWLLFLILIYVITSEFNRVMGKKEIMRMLFG